MDSVFLCPLRTAPTARCLRVEQVGHIPMRCSSCFEDLVTRADSCSDCGETYCWRCYLMSPEAHAAHEVTTVQFDE